MYSETDEKNLKVVQGLFADSVLLDFTSVNGGSPAMRSPEQITKARPAFDKTKHNMSNFEINETKNLATTHYIGRTAF